MPRNTKLLTTITLTGLIGFAAIPAIAQQMGEVQTEDYQPPATEAMELTTPSQADYFAAADLDSDGALSRDEFTLLTNTMADSGDVDAASIRDGGTYDDAFIAKDMDGDGALNLGEIIEVEADVDVVVEPELEAAPL
jgi:hypothetical protein